MCPHQGGVHTQQHLAWDNREYVRGLLREREPEFLVLLQSAEHQLELELARESRD
jgi:hypothetical protein